MKKVLLSDEYFNKIMNESEQDEYVDEENIKIYAPPKTNNWNHLYEWLKPIFGEKYKDAANGFMIMDELILPKHKKKFYLYKHWRTRKSLLLDENGWPYTLLHKNNADSSYPEHLKQYDTKVVGVRKIDNKTSFNNVYGDLIKWIKNAEEKSVCVDGVCMKPSFFDKYSEVFPLLLKQLKDNGWIVLSTENDPEDIIKNNPDIFKTKE